MLTVDLNFQGASENLRRRDRVIRELESKDEDDWAVLGVM